VFVEGDAYPIDTYSLDLREEDISFAYYDSLHAQLPKCDILWNVPFQGGKQSCDVQQLTINTLTEEDIAVMETYFPNLRSVDASGCHNYAVLETLVERLPQVDVTYAVSLGQQTYAPGITDIVLSNGEYDYVTLLENLTYLRNLTTVKLRMPELTDEQITQLKEAYEQITFTTSVEVYGQEYDVETTEQLDLSGITGPDVPQVAEQIKKLPGLTYVNLNPENGIGALSLEDVKNLMDAVPEVTFAFTFDFYGHQLSTADEEVHIKNTKIGDDGEQTVRNALDLLKNCKRFVLENCGVSNETMAKLRDDYRDRTKVVWRVSYGKGTTMTDAEVIRAVYDLVDDNCHNLIYCEDAKFMDIGHNEYLDACEFVSGMKSLEYVIISGAPIKSLEPFRNCKNLKMLEAAFCEYITDVSPLADCPNLQMLNISNTHVTDLSPLDKLPLTHLTVRNNPSGKCRLTQEEQDRVMKQHPDCWISFAGAQPYGVGWRYGEDEVTPLDHYKVVRIVFRLAQDPNIPNHVGWYLKDNEREEVDKLEEAMDAALAALQQPAAQETVPEETVPEETTSETTAVEENND
jgi:Leucine-rich repeat (LRR) protein